MSQAWPDKEQFLALKAQVDNLDTPSVFFGQGQETEAGVQPTGATSQRPVRSLTIRFTGAGGGVLFADIGGSVNWNMAFEKLSFGSLTSADNTTLYQFGLGAPETSRPTLTNGGYRVTFPIPLPGAAFSTLSLNFSEEVLWTGSDSVQRSPQLLSVEAADDDGVISGWTPSLYLSYPIPRVFGRLGARHMPVHADPSDGAIGTGAVALIAPPSGTPYLLYVDKDSNYFHMLLTPGLPGDSGGAT